MTNELKQRLVGAVVITAIAAIFLPMLFDDPVQNNGKAVSEIVIPEPPVIAKPDDPLAANSQQQDYAVAEDVDSSGSEQPSTEPQHKDTAMQGLSSAELAHEAELDKQAAERMTVEELAMLKDKRERQKILKERAALDEEDSVDKILREHRALEKKVIDKLESDRKAKDKFDADLKALDRVETERKNKAKLEKDRKAKEKLEADKKLKDKLLLEAQEKETAKKLAKNQEEYEKLAELKAKEKALADKKAAEKLAADTKLAAKQQALDDKAAQAKIAADKLAAQKSASNGPASGRWFIRVGSFSQESNALSLRDKLRQQGFPAVMDTIKSSDKGKLYRLRVGPELNKARAEKIRQKMDAENHTNSLLELE